jgi:hypothetical protein
MSAPLTRAAWVEEVKSILGRPEARQHGIHRDGLYRIASAVEHAVLDLGHDLIVTWQPDGEKLEPNADNGMLIVDDGQRTDRLKLTYNGNVLSCAEGDICILSLAAYGRLSDMFVEFVSRTVWEGQFKGRPWFDGPMNNCQFVKLSQIDDL